MHVSLCDSSHVFAHHPPLFAGLALEYDKYSTFSLSSIGHDFNCSVFLALLKVRRRVARMARMASKDVELKLTRGTSGSGGTGADSYIGGYHGGAKGERRSVEGLYRSNSRRLGDIGLR